MASAALRRAVEAAGSGDLDAVREFVSSHEGQINASNGVRRLVTGAARCGCSGRVVVVLPPHSHHAPVPFAVRRRATIRCSISLRREVTRKCASSLFSTALISRPPTRMCVRGLIYGCARSLSPQGVHSCLCFRHQQHSTPLHRASWGGRLSVINFLISAGANVNAVKPNKDTALHLAGYQNHAECVAALLAAGADPNASKTVRSTASAFPPPLVFPQAAPDVTLRMCGGVPTERRHNAACGVPKGQHCCCTSSRGRRS